LSKRARILRDPAASAIPLLVRKPTETKPIVLRVAGRRPGGRLRPFAGARPLLLKSGKLTGGRHFQYSPLAENQ